MNEWKCNFCGKTARYYNGKIGRKKIFMCDRHWDEYLGFKEAKTKEQFKNGLEDLSDQEHLQNYCESKKTREGSSTL